MATEMVDLRIRVSEKKRERLKILKTEFGFKSMSKLVNIFIDSGFERIEDKFHFIDKEQGDEIKKIIMQIANDVHDIKINLSRIGSNVNQIAKATNMGMNKFFAAIGLSPSPLCPNICFLIRTELRKQLTI